MLIYFLFAIIIVCLVAALIRCKRNRITKDEYDFELELKAHEIKEKFEEFKKAAQSFNGSVNISEGGRIVFFKIGSFKCDAKVNIDADVRHYRKKF